MDGRIIWYRSSRSPTNDLYVNQNNETLSNVVIQDNHQGSGLKLDKDDFRVFKGTWRPNGTGTG